MNNLVRIAPFVLSIACAELPESDLTSAPEQALHDLSCPATSLYQPGLFSLPEMEEQRIVFTPDGKTALFSRSKEPFFVERKTTIYISRRERESWSVPVVAPFSGEYGDIDPFVSPDGRRVYFSSNRPVAGEPRTDVDLWYVELRGSSFSAPVNLGPTINSRYDELYPSVSARGDVYFASDRPGGLGGFDLYRARVGAAPENLGPEVNSELFEFNPWISPAGNVLVFASAGRPDGLGAEDLYASVRLGAAWSKPWNLGPCINSAEGEYHPTPVLSEGALYFIRHGYEPWVPGEIQRIDLRASVLGLLAAHGR